MAIKVTTTKGAAKYPKILVYSKSGVGKTRLIATAPKPVIISSENKAASLSGEDIKILSVSSIQDFEDALNLVLTKEYSSYKTICIDSISDITEIAIQNEKPNHNDPRKAYGVVQDKMLELLRQIRDSKAKKYWYVIAKAKMTENDDGPSTFGPMMPGRQMGPAVPYLFDYVFPLRIADEGEEDSYIYLQTTIKDDTKWDAKDSSGKLSRREKPNLANLFEKLAKQKIKKRK